MRKMDEDEIARLGRAFTKGGNANGANAKLLVDHDVGSLELTFLLLSNSSHFQFFVDG